MARFEGTDRYRITRTLGAGGMGVVYAAQDAVRQEEVALKTLRRLDPAAVYRFKREFRALADFDHPNLVSLYELVAEDDRCFFTMELVGGTDFLRYVGHDTWPGADTITREPSFSGADLPAPAPLPPPQAAGLPHGEDAAEAARASTARRVDISQSVAPDDLEFSEDDPGPAGRDGDEGDEGDEDGDEGDDGELEPDDEITKGPDNTRPPRRRGRLSVPRVAQPLPVRLGFESGPSGKLDIPRLRHALRQLVEGIEALHGLGCLHRDIKPSNVLVTHEGRLVLLDLGLVTWTNPSEASFERYVAGTAAYMSPEQAVAKPLTEASDLYSVGVILYEALTGTRPFRGSFDVVVAAKQVGEPLPPSKLVPGIPADLESLCMDLLSFKPANRPKPKEILERIGKAPPPPTLEQPAYQPPASLPIAAGDAFYGRERHLEILRGAYKDLLMRRRPATVHIHGPSGMGKSALLRKFLDEIAAGRDGAVLLPGRCYERESVPYKAVDGVVDAISRYLRSLPRTRVEALLPRGMHNLARLFPVLRQVEAIALARGASEAAPDPMELRRRAFRALRELLGRLGERRPVVLCVDDLQWGDLDSVQLLADLMRGAEPPRLLLVVTYRRAEIATSPHLIAFRRAQALQVEGVQVEPVGRETARYAPVPDEAEVMEIEVDGLSPDEAVELARSLLEADPADADAERRAQSIARESRGNPFFVQELVRHLKQTQAEAPPKKVGEESSGSRSGMRSLRVSLEEVLTARVEGLPDPPRHVLELVAVAGRPLARAVISRATELGKAEHAAIDLLRRAHLVRRRETGGEEVIEPYHDRLREVLLETLPAWKLRERHLQLALAIEGTRHADPEALAEYFLGAGHLDKAGEYAVEAAKQATAALAFDRAAMLYRLAMRLLKNEAIRSLGLDLLLADALAQAGRSYEAAGMYAGAVQYATGLEVLRLRSRAAEEFLRSGHLDEGIDALRDVLADVRMKLPDTPRSAITSLLTRRGRIRLRGLGWKERTEAEVLPADRMKIDVCWVVASGLAMVDPIRGADFQTRNLILSLDAGEPYRVARSLAMEAAYQCTSGSRGRERARRLLGESRAIALRLQHPEALGLCTAIEGVIAYEAGEWERARVLCEQAEATYLDECSGATLEVMTNRHFLLLSLLQLGELRELSLRVPEYVQDAEDRGDRFSSTSFRNGCMNVAWLLQDDVGGARIAVDEAMEPWANHGFLLQHYEELYARTTIELYAGRGAAAWSLVQTVWPGLKKAQLLNIQQLHLEALFFRGRAAIAAAVDDTELPDNPPALLAAAMAAAARIKKERMPWADPLADLLRAGVSAVSGDVDSALALLRVAVPALEAQGMKIHAAAARWQRGVLQGAEEGREDIQLAGDVFAAQGVLEPAVMARALAPGLFPPRGPSPEQNPSGKND